MKQRHGCLTAWLVLMIITNSLTAMTYLFASALIKQGTPNMPAWAVPVLGVGCALNVVFAVALFQWKKWAFFGFAATAAVAFVVNVLVGVNFGAALFGLAGVGVLYAVLQIGDVKGWHQLQ